RLEKFVHKLLSQYEQLLDKNAQLQRLLQQRQDEIDELHSRVDSADTERGDISNRIQHLIEEIEEWQSAFASESEEQVETEADSSQEQKESSDEQPEDQGHRDEGSAGEDSDREASQQRNLFQVDSSEGDTSRG
ncbi:MAG TPA: hypothetical protein VJ969_10245, partial [Desulfopila sp.]|nr:hypothetical protein [Desulfopila sp.]